MSGVEEVKVMMGQAARSGARMVKATEVDPWAIAAIGMNARLNQVEHVQVREAGIERQWCDQL